MAAVKNKLLLSVLLVTFFHSYSFSQDLDFSPHYFVDGHALIFPIIGVLGFYGNVAIGKQFSPNLGLGLSYTGIIQQTFLPESYSGLGVRYQLNRRLFFLGADVGAILKYAKTDDYYNYEYTGSSGIFLNAHCGIKFWNWLKVGVITSYVPKLVRLEITCPGGPNNCTGMQEFKGGFWGVMPFLGVHLTFPTIISN